jgi:hypothetical protein
MKMEMDRWQSARVANIRWRGSRSSNAREAVRPMQIFPAASEDRKTVKHVGGPLLKGLSQLKVPSLCASRRWRLLPPFGGDRQKGKCISMTCPRVAQAPY